MNNIILLRKRQQDKTFTIYIYIYNIKSNSGGSVFQVARHTKDNSTRQ